MHGLARRSVFPTTHFILCAMSRLCVWHTVYALALAVFAHAAPAQAPSPDTPRFDILEFVIEGDTLLGAPALERAVYPFLGPGKTVADAEGARRALQQAYQEAGYLSVSVVLPPQRVDEGSGEVRLQVIQGVVERLKVTGAEHFLPSGIRQGLPSLAPGSVPQFTEVQQELGQLAALAPDRRITPLLAAGSGGGEAEGWSPSRTAAIANPSLGFTKLAARRPCAGRQQGTTSTGLDMAAKCSRRHQSTRRPQQVATTTKNFVRERATSVPSLPELAAQAWLGLRRSIGRVAPPLPPGTSLTFYHIAPRGRSNTNWIASTRSDSRSQPFQSLA